jgi:hypothetical protein
MGGGWVAALTTLRVEGQIVGASTTLPADSRVGECGGSALDAPRRGGVASLAANVAVAQPTAAGWVFGA